MVVTLLIFTGKSLFWVAVLLLIITYIYAVISFAFLRIEFENRDENPNFFCDTVDECFISVLRFGLLDSFLVCSARYFFSNLFKWEYT